MAYTLMRLISFLYEVYSFLILVYVLMSWVPQMRSTQIGEWLGRLVEPYLSVFRRFIPPLGMIDISPIVALFALYFIQAGLMAIVRFFL
jgi:YggT family protein